MADQRFPAAQISDAGYGAIWQGQKPLWNGVAILARGTDPIELRRELPGDSADTLAPRLEDAAVDRWVRGLDRASDHAPPG